MGATRQGNGTKPHLVAATASTFVLATGAALIAYFVQARGAGFAVELAGPRALELQVLFVAVVALAVLTQLLVANAVRRTSRGEGMRPLLRRALEIDVTDPEAVREFAPVPELRELVATVVTEKAHVRDLSDRLESMRGEIDAMTAGMRRSVEQLDRLREENMSVVGNQIAVLWNSLVERVRFAEEQRALATAKAAVDVGAGAVEDGDLGTLVNRLDELESELGRLRSAVAPPATMFGKREVPVESVHVPQAPSRWRGPAAAADSTPAAPLRTPARDIFFEEEAPAEPATVSTPAGTSSLPVSDFGADDDLPFPHFVGLPVSTPMDRVEVTYEAHGGEEVVDLPASALLFESETDEEENAELEVFDLRSFGAREFEP